MSEATPPPSSEEAKPGPEKRTKGVTAAARRLVGAFTKRGYPEDERTRRRTTVAGLLATALGIISWQVYDASAARKEAKDANAVALKIVSEQAERNRQDVHDMIKATAEFGANVKELGDNVKVLAEEVRKDRGAYNRPATYRLRVQPAPREPPPPGGARPP